MAKKKSKSDSNIDITIEMRNVADLSHDPNNLRVHNSRNIDQICASLRRYKQQKPIVVNAEGIVMAGNGLLEAAIKMGWKRIAVVQTDLTGIEATLFAIADNRTAELSTWDYEGLDETLKAIGNSEDFELSDIMESVGFDELELNKLLGVEEHKPPADPDKIGDYKQEDETVDVKLTGIPFDDRKVVREVIEAALASKNIHYDDLSVY